MAQKDKKPTITVTEEEAEYLVGGCSDNEFASFIEGTLNKFCSTSATGCYQTLMELDSQVYSRFASFMNTHGDVLEKIGLKKNDSDGF